jgi:hypothetical protein
MKEFDFYGTAGVIAPGTVLVVGMTIMFFPDQGDLLKTIFDVSLGSLGIGLVLAYVAGQLLQAVGNAIEAAWWRPWGGMPTDWVRTDKRDLLSPSQRALIESRLRVALKDPDLSFTSVTAKHWYAITRQVYAAVAAASRNERVDIFNGNYGLCRGVAAGLMVLLISQLVINWQAWKTEMLLVFLLGLAIYRMHRFAIRYGREVFVQYLQLAPSTDCDATPRQERT